MSQSSDSLDRVEPGSPSDAASAIYCDGEEYSEQQSMANSSDLEEFSEQQSMANSSDLEEFSEQQSMATIPQDSEEVEQQSMVTVPQDSEEVEQQSMVTVPQDSEEVEQQSKADPPDNSRLDLLLRAIAHVELKEAIQESQTIVTEFDPADPHSCADVADCDQQGVRVFSPRNFSFQELLDSNVARCLNSDGSEPGAPSDAAPSNDVEKRIIDHDNNDWKEWLTDHEGDD